MCNYSPFLLFPSSAILSASFTPLIYLSTYPFYSSASCSTIMNHFLHIKDNVIYQLESGECEKLKTRWFLLDKVIYDCIFRNHIYLSEKINKDYKITFPLLHSIASSSMPPDTNIPGLTDIYIYWIGLNVMSPWAVLRILRTPPQCKNELRMNTCISPLKKKHVLEIILHVRGGKNHVAANSPEIYKRI